MIEILSVKCCLNEIFEFIPEQFSNKYGKGTRNQKLQFTRIYSSVYFDTNTPDF